MNSKTENLNENMMKEQIYEIIKNCEDVYVSWFTVKDFDLSRYQFHKYCGELVDEGRIRTKRFSGTILYFI